MRGHRRAGQRGERSILVPKGQGRSVTSVPAGSPAPTEATRGGRQAFVQDPAKSGEDSRRAASAGASAGAPASGVWPGGPGAGAKQLRRTPPWAPGAASAAEAGGPLSCLPQSSAQPGPPPGGAAAPPPRPLPGLPAALRLPCRPRTRGSEPRVLRRGTVPTPRECSARLAGRLGGRESCCRAGADQLSLRVRPEAAFARRPQRLDPAAPRVRSTRAGPGCASAGRSQLRGGDASPGPLERPGGAAAASGSRLPRPRGASGLRVRQRSRDPPESGTARRLRARPRPPPEEAASPTRGRPARPGPPSPRAAPDPTRRPGVADRTTGRRPSAEARAPPRRLPGPSLPPPRGSPGLFPARGPLWSQPSASGPRPAKPGAEGAQPGPWRPGRAPSAGLPSWGLASGPQSRGGVPRGAAARRSRLQAPGPATGSPVAAGVLQPLSSEACMVGRGAECQVPR